MAFVIVFRLKGTCMVLTKDELIAALQNEVRILLHLAGKVDRHHLDYRLTPSQRSTLELLRYLTFMGPELIKSIRDGKFDMGSFEAVGSTVAGLGFDETVARIQALPQQYAELIGAISDEDLRAPLEMFSRKSSRGALLVNIVLCHHTAYRTQIFCYLKACGREELSTSNLWAGRDPVAAA